MATLPHFLKSCINFALPPRCAGCGEIVSDDYQLCKPCWQDLDFLSGEGCALCGVPLPPTAAVCAPCLQSPPDHDGAHAAVSYGEIARKVALNLKHGRRIGLAQFAAKAMERLIPIGPALLIPVPLHRWRIWSRGFNQSALIAAALAKRTGGEFIPDALLRTKRTPILRGLGRKERALAVRGAFSANPKHNRVLKGRAVLLIDDVYTTGSTANACARALKKAGAVSVHVVSWARVLIDD
jgi:ComF family protein